MRESPPFGSSDRDMDMEKDGSVEVLKEILAAKDRECSDLREQLLLALQDKKNMQRDFDTKQRDLQEECSGLRRQLESADGGSSQSVMPTTPPNSTAPPSECDDDAEMVGVQWFDHGSQQAQGQQSPEKCTPPLIENLRTNSMMRRAKSTPSLIDPDAESTESRDGPLTETGSGLMGMSMADRSSSSGDEDNKQRFETDALQRVRETHRRNGDRNVAGFMRDLGFVVEGGWNPSEEDFEKQKKRGLILCHPDKQQKKPLREQCLCEAVFKELNEWTYKPPLDRPHFGFRGMCPQPRSTSPGAATPPYALHRRSTSGTYSGTSGYTSGYKNSASAMEIASRLARRSVGVANKTAYTSPRNARGSTAL